MVSIWDKSDLPLSQLLEDYDEIVNEETNEYNSMPIKYTIDPLIGHLRTLKAFVEKVASREAIELLSQIDGNAQTESKPST